MGSGKSRLGKKLGTRLKLDFVDLDQWIVRQQGRSIPMIFSQEGEEQFREYERNALREWFEKDGYVIACGGGTPCYKDNMDLMNKAGKTVYLDVAEEELFRRLSRNRKHRPLISQLDDTGLKKFIRDKIRKRLPYFKKASVWIDPVDTSLDIIAKSLLI